MRSELRGDEGRKTGVERGVGLELEEGGHEVGVGRGWGWERMGP